MTLGIDTVEWNAYVLLRTCDAFAAEGRETNDVPREVATWVSRWCVGEATKRDVIDALAGTPITTGYTDTALMCLLDGAQCLAMMVLGGERTINSVVAFAEHALWDLWGDAQKASAAVAGYSRDRDEAKNMAWAEKARADAVWATMNEAKDGGL